MSPLRRGAQADYRWPDASRRYVSWGGAFFRNLDEHQSRRETYVVRTPLSTFLAAARRFAAQLITSDKLDRHDVIEPVPDEVLQADSRAWGDAREAFVEAFRDLE